MIQKRDDKKPVHRPFKLKALMLDLDEYLRIFVLPQIPAGFADYRSTIRSVMDAAWRELFTAARTEGRTRQSHLVKLNVEMSMVEVYLKEIRDVCFRKKEKRKLDKASARRFEVCARKQKAVMDMIWAWSKNEAEKKNPKRAEKTAGLVDAEEP